MRRTMAPSDSVIDVGLPPRRTLLVVDDNAFILSVVKNAVPAQYDLLTAEDGREALNKIRWQKVDLILLDLLMPDMGGMEVIHALQAEPNTKDTPVVVMTAKPLDDSTIGMLRNEPNVAGVLRKPFDNDALVATLNRAARGLAGDAGETLANPDLNAIIYPRVKENPKKDPPQGS